MSSPSSPDQMASGSYFFKGISCLLLDTLSFSYFSSPRVYFSFSLNPFKMSIKRVAKRSRTFEHGESNNLSSILPRFNVLEQENTWNFALKPVLPGRFLNLSLLHTKGDGTLQVLQN